MASRKPLFECLFELLGLAARLDLSADVVRLEQRIDDRSVIVEHMTRFARRVRAGAVGRDLAVVAHSAAIHIY